MDAIPPETPNTKVAETHAEKTITFTAGIIERLGISTVFVAVLIYGIWKSVAWTGETVVVPLVNSALEFKTEAADHMEKANEIAERRERTFEATSKNVEKIELQQTRLTEHLGRLTESLDRHLVGNAGNLTAADEPDAKPIAPKAMLAPATGSTKEEE